MNQWQFQEAKAKLTELVNSAIEHPQLITRHGEPTVVVLDVKAYEKLLGKKKNLVTFLRNSPLAGVTLDLTRDKSGMRDIEL